MTIKVRTWDDHNPDKVYDDVSIDGEWFETTPSDKLIVYKTSAGNEVVAVFAPGCWAFARKVQS